MQILGVLLICLNGVVSRGEKIVWQEPLISRCLCGISREICKPTLFYVFRYPYFSLFRGSFSCVFCFSLGASLSHNAWLGALLTQDETLGRFGLAVTLGVALPATMLIYVSLTCSGRNAGFFCLLLFQFFSFFDLF